jgi:glycosyltransferase involved in cell wall biosynthesis
MKFDFYLSEMSISDHHGGGLTLQRVLGEELKNIDHLIYVSRFAADIDTIPALKSKIYNLTSPWDSDFMRRIIGRTGANSISKNLSVIKIDAKKAASAIVKRIKKADTISGLICPQGAQSIYTIEALKKHVQVKYTTWIMDDHLISYQNGKWVYPLGVEAVFAKHLQEAEHVFVISPIMQQFYQDRFGVKSTVLFGPADPPKEKNAPRHIASKIRIGYFGAITDWQMDAVHAVANALDKAGPELHIYSVVDRLPDEINVEGVFFMGRLPHNEVLNTMQKYDAILLPMSFSEKKRSMSEFNIATKMSEYLASGVPILAIGPPYAAMMKYLDEHVSAILVKSTDKITIKNALEQLNDRALIDLILSNAKNCVVSETGTVAMQRRWLKRL